MNYKKHLEKAKRLESAQQKLEPTGEWELIIEGVYGAVLHYIACICEERVGNHINTHKGLPRFLDNQGLPKIAELFRRLDYLRQSKYYGGQQDGKSAEEARAILVELKKTLGRLGE